MNGSVSGERAFVRTNAHAEPYFVCKVSERFVGCKKIVFVSQ